MAQLPEVEDPEALGYEMTADLVEKLAAASNPAFQEEEVDSLSSMPEEQLMNQQTAIYELMSAPVLSDADTESLESAVPEEVMPVPQEMSVQRLMEMPTVLEAEVLPSLPVFTHNANDEQPGTSDVPKNAPVDTAVAKEKRSKHSQENECIICHVSVVQIDRHLKHVHGDLLTETEQTLIKDYYRFRDSKTVVRSCSTCMRRVASVPSHKSRCLGKIANRNRLLDHLVNNLRAVPEEDEVPEPVNVTVPVDSTASTIGDATRQSGMREARQKEIERAERG